MMAILQISLSVYVTCSYFSRVRELDVEIVGVSNALRTMEINEMEASEREEQLSSKLNEMVQRYNEVNQLFTTKQNA